MDLEKAKKLALYHANTGTSAEVANQMPAVRMVIKNLEDSLKEIQRLRAELEALKAAQAWQPIETVPIGEPIELELLIAEPSYIRDDKAKEKYIKHLSGKIFWRKWMPLPPTDSEGGAG